MICYLDSSAGFLCSPDLRQRVARAPTRPTAGGTWRKRPTAPRPSRRASRRQGRGPTIQFSASSSQAPQKRRIRRCEIHHQQEPDNSGGENQKIDYCIEEATSISTIVIFLSFLLTGLFISVVVHETGHLLVRKAFKWPTSHLRIPRRSAKRLLSAYIFGTRIEIGADLAGWLRFDGEVGPWPLDEAFFRNRPTREAVWVALSGGVANLIQFALSVLLMRITHSHIAFLWFWTLAAFGLGSALLNVVPTLLSRNSDGIWLYQHFHGHLPTAAKTALTAIVAAFWWATMGFLLKPP